MIRASILGATGYSGGELLSILLKDPGCRIQHVTSDSSKGRSVAEIHPFLRRRTSLRFEKADLNRLIQDSDVVFSCFPPTVGLQSTAKLIKAGIKVIDLSADFRLHSPAQYKKWYKKSHSASTLLKSRAYGLPELFREKIRQARLIANPGCYATAAILSAAPLVRSGWIDNENLIIDAKSGLTGAGKKMSSSLLFSEADENIQPYAVASHRHQPEIESLLTEVTKRRVQVTFTPHLIPMRRGLLSVLYATLKKQQPIAKCRAVFEKTYQYEPFVRLLPPGELPKTKSVQHTNYCDIGIFQDTRTKRLIIVAAIDNLGKGAAAQAVQNMNILFGRSELEGLL